MVLTHHEASGDVGGGDVEDLDVGKDGEEQTELVAGKAGLQGGLLQLGAGNSCQPRSLEAVWRWRRPSALPRRSEIIVIKPPLSLYLVTMLC